MSFKKRFGTVLAGTAAGAVNGLLGAGGGMVLIPLLAAFTELDDEQMFPASVSIILPISAVSLMAGTGWDGLPVIAALPFLLGGALGGAGAWALTGRIPAKWLHRVLGFFILWGGVRYLC